MPNNAPEIHVATLYRFAQIADPQAVCGPLREICEASDVRGTLILAREGINGTIAGTRAGLDAVLSHLRGLPGCAGFAARESRASGWPFARMKVRIKPEIVTLGTVGADPTVAVGTHVDPLEWNDLIRAPDVAVIDTRNAYEVAIGSFAGAVDPGTASFRDFPAWWEAQAERFRGKRIAMYCTGGIRCEKASAYLLGRGVEEVFHLRGGILAYLEAGPGESLWQGECFVFDERVSVGPGLAQGDCEICHACGGAVTASGRAHPDFEPGVSCAACIARYDDAARARFRMRERQMARALRAPQDDPDA